MKRREMKLPKPPKAIRRASWRTRLARLLGLALCVAGFAAIALGWAGAARKTCVDCQIPYLISGGAAGVGLVALGTGLLLMAQMRTEARRLAAAIDHMTWTLAERFMGGPTGAMDVPQEGEPGEAPTLVRSGSDRDGRDPDLGAGP